MREDTGLLWLYANDPYAQLLTRADYRRRFGILSIAGEREPVRGSGQRPLRPPYLVASGLAGRPQTFRKVCRCGRCRAAGAQLRWQVRHDQQGLLVARHTRAGG